MFPQLPPVYVFFVFCFLVYSCAGQECLSSCDAGLSTCGRIQYNIFVNQSDEVISAETAVTKFLHEAIHLVTYKDYFPVTPYCVAYLENFMCNVYHPSCDPDNATPTPISPCIDMCYNLNTYCGPIKQYLPAEVQQHFNCSGVDEETGEALYSNTTCSNVITPSSPYPCVNNSAPDILQFTGVCTKFNATAAPKVYQYCGPFIPENVYIPMDWPMIQTFLDDYCAIPTEQIKNMYPVSPQKCHKHLMSVICGLVFPTCDSVFVPYYNTTVGVPRFPCASYCDVANENCVDFFTRSNSTNFLIPCKAFPNASYVVPIAPGTIVPEECTSQMFPDNPVSPWTIPPATCPPETGRKTIKSDDDSYCDLLCPDASYSLAEWGRLSRLTISGASFSLAAMAFLTLSYLLQFERRKFPASMHFWEFVATAMFAISFLIGGDRPEKDVWCYDEGTNATQENNTRCGVQGFFFIFFGISLTAWCCVIAFCMFYAIVFNKRIKNLRRHSALFHLFGWGVPAVFAIAALATKSIGYGPPLAWCFIHFDGFGFSSGDFIDTLLYIPEAVLFFSILFMFICTVTKIIYVRHKNISHSSVARRGSRTFKAQVFIICFTIFEWRLQIQGNDKIATVGLQWTYCKIKEVLGISTTAVCGGNKNPARVDYAHTAFESLLLSGIGVLIFIGFGADPNIYKHWIKIGKLIHTREWAKLQDLILHGKDPFSVLSKSTSNRSMSRVSRSTTDSPTTLTPTSTTTTPPAANSGKTSSKGGTGTDSEEYEDSDTGGAVELATTTSASIFYFFLLRSVSFYALFYFDL